MAGTYLPRIADRQLEAVLGRIGAVLVRGAKWCGKTSTSEQLAESALYLQDPRRGRQYLQMAETDPPALLAGATPRLIDEWQMAPSLWNAVRYEVDRRHRTGQFILTGSAVPADDSALHTGTGRIARLTMRPMSLFESGESDGSVSLSRLFEEAADGPAGVVGESNLTIDGLAFLTSRGGWPESVVMTTEGRRDEALALPYDYHEAIVESDISRVDDVRRNPATARTLLRSLARFSAQPAKIPTIRDDLSADGTSASEKTISTYINALRRLFVIEPLGAWAPKLRSKTAIRKALTWYFTDPSIACAALGAGPERLVDDLPTFGFLFETLCVRDLRVYAEAIGGTVSHFRDRNGVEADAIVQLRDGRWAAIEVKFGSGDPVETGAKGLRRFVDRLDPSVRRPEFLMVLTGTGLAYRRTDGVIVVPVGCLGP